MYLSKQKLRRLPPKTQPLPRLCSLAQHSPQLCSLTQRTVIIQAKTDSQFPPPPEETNPRGCYCPTSSAFVDLGAQEDSFFKYLPGSLKTFLALQELGTEKKAKNQPIWSKTQSSNLGFEPPEIMCILLYSEQ